MKPTRDPHKLAETIRQAIDALPLDDDTEAAVVRIFADTRATPDDKGTAFWRLDEHPGKFPGYCYPNSTGWHSKLRRTRNHPEHGPALFATFRG